MMPFQWVFLWSDVLFFALLFCVIIGFTYASRRKPFRLAWKKVLQRKLALSSVVILSLFVIITLLDSMHFRLRLPGQDAQGGVHYATQIQSVFDRLLAPMSLQYEKSYSAPFALHAYSKEALKTNGTTVRHYPRLTLAGVGIQSPREFYWDLTRLIFWGVATGLFAFAGLSAGIILLMAKLYQMTWTAMLGAVREDTLVIPWRVLFGTMAVVIFTTAIVLTLNTHYHVLGTDKIGQDVLYQSLKSIRTGLLIGTLTTLIMLPFAIIFGLLAGYCGGWVDDLIQYVYTTLSSIPAVLLIAAAILSLQIFIANHPEYFHTLADRADIRLLGLCLILGVSSWTSLCRLLRAETLKLREVDYIQAARVLGTSHIKILSKHILPNVMPIILITVVLDFSTLVLAEAVLSYVGVGVDPTTLSWGNMINSARLELAREPIVWWPIVAAFVMMFLLVLATNLFADAVRDGFDPRST